VCLFIVQHGRAAAPPSGCNDDRGVRRQVAIDRSVWVVVMHVRVYDERGNALTLGGRVQ
jgi:hypothetical protein